MRLEIGIDINHMKKNVCKGISTYGEKIKAWCAKQYGLYGNTLTTGC